jgi:iron(III) transport system ATP-binding protein
MTVFENVAYGLRRKKLQEREVTTRVTAALEMLQLAQFGRRYPSQLSGGQQQRVALGRSLVLEPYVLLLDEPLSNLDVVLRESTRSELKNLLKKVGITAVYVTHDQDEAFVLSDRILVMNHGRIVQAGTPAEIYERPASTFVCRFVGRSNVFDGRLVRKVGKHVSILLDGIGPFEADVEADIPVADGDECLLVVKPSEIELVSDKASAQAAVFSGTVVQREYRGDFTDYRIDVAGREVLVRDSQKTLRNGESVSLRINARNPALLPRD